jgi:two-component system, OmpR family, response regulator
MLLQNVSGRDEVAAQRQPHGDDSYVNATRILIADGDPGMVQMASYFRERKFDAVLASGRHEMLRYLAVAAPSVVILDLCLGHDDGLELLLAIRSRSDVPVIITAGHRRDDVELIVGLELGADSYVIKPFTPRKLLAHVRAVLRRQNMARVASVQDPQRGGFRFDGWKLELRTRHLTDRQGKQVLLTKSQYALLIAFLNAPQRPLTRAYLLQETRVHEDVFDRSIDVQVLRLRRKLEPVPTATRHIHTERGVGYVFVTPVERF